MRALVVVLWRAGLRIHEALMLSESDLDPRRGAILVRGARAEPRHLGASAGVRRRLLPTSSGTPTPSRWLAKSVPLPVIQRQLGHAHLGITSTYLQGIDTYPRPRPPMLPASAGLRL